MKNHAKTGAKSITSTAPEAREARPAARRPRNSGTSDTGYGRWLPWLALAAAATYLGILMFATSVDVPREDEWMTPGEFLLASAQGNASFEQHLFRQHNESRVIFSQLLTLGITRLFGTWNQHVIHVVNWLVLVLTGAAFVLLGQRVIGQSASLTPALRQSEKHTSPRQGHHRSSAVVLALAVAVVFSPTQWRNYLSGGQLITLSLPFLLMSGLLANTSTRLSFPVKTLLAALCAFVATFTYANGMLQWALLWPLWVDGAREGFVKTAWRGPKRRQVIVSSALYVAAALGTAWWYLADYIQPPGVGEFGASAMSPAKILSFYVTWQMGPLLPSRAMIWAAEGRYAPLAGIILLWVLFGIGVVVFAWRHLKPTLERASWAQPSERARRLSFWPLTVSFQAGQPPLQEAPSLISETSHGIQRSRFQGFSGSWVCLRYF